MRILIIEDESAAARRIEKIILEIQPDAEIVAKLESVTAAVSWFQGKHFQDVVIMDIHLADGECFEIFKKVEVNCPVIFTTAYDQYAIKAFKVNSVDYILKPVKKDELEFSFRKLKENTLGINNPSLIALLEQLASPAANYQERFIVRRGSLINSVETKDIVAFYTEDKLVFIHNYSNQRHPIDISLDKLQDMLNPKSFFRINRGMIINYAFIHQMHAYLKGRIKIEMKIPLPEYPIVSADRAGSFKSWLGR